MSDRRSTIASIRARLGARKVIWFGTRVDDALSLLALPEFSEAFVLQGSPAASSWVSTCTLEGITGRRVDLDRFDVDDHLSDPAVSEFRDRLLRAMASPNVVIPYRPTTLLSAVGFARKDTTTVLGMFRDQQRAFEHKPWMELEVGKLGISCVPWRYVADADQASLTADFARGPMVLRQSRSTGGVGLVRVENEGELAAAWPFQDEGFVSVAPYVDAMVPLNIGGVVFNDGVILHPASLQLIGISSLIDRPFGYCGNDFAAALELTSAQRSAVERATTGIGEWLRGLGYRGAFGVDYLLGTDDLLFMEVNPRFQGSTHASCQLSERFERRSIVLDHVAAFLDLPAPHQDDLWPDGEQLISHLVLHHRGDPIEGSDIRERYGPIERALRDEPACERIDMQVPDGVTLEHGGVPIRATISGSVTTDGFSLSHPVAAIVNASPTHHW